MKIKFLIPIVSLLATIVTLTSFQFDTEGIPNDDVACRMMAQTPCEISDSTYFADGVFGSLVSWHTSNCDELSENLKGVILTFENKIDRRLVLTAQFENIKLIEKESGKMIAPAAIHQLGKKYMTSISFGRLVNFMKRGRRVQMIFLFPKAEKGDQIVIDKFVNVEIQ